MTTYYNGGMAQQSEGIRQQNLARLLQLVHREGPLARAVITEATGLNRSTVGDLVSDLAARGLVTEAAPDPSRRVGRPSPMVTPAADVVTIAANPEVDALEIAAVGLDRSVTVRERIELPSLISPEDAAALIAERVQAWRVSELAGARIAGVGLAVPGLVRSSDGLVRSAPHLHWNNARFGALTAAATGLPVNVGNDASLGALAEHRFGAAQGFADVVYLNGGASGIGGGLIVNGMPVAGARGYAGEFGHNRPGIATPADRRGRDGILEDDVSRARLLTAVGLTSADDLTLSLALETNASPAVTEEVARQRRILSTALANAVNVLDPAVIVLGGFLAMIAAYDLLEFNTMVRSQVMDADDTNLNIRPAALAHDRLLIGAAEIAFQALLNDPTGAALNL